MKKKKKPHRHAKAGHRSRQPDIKNNTSIQEESVKYDDTKIAGKNAVELNGVITAETDTCEDEDSSVRIDFYPFAYSLHNE
ncbi:unnamed protein product, partial [Onchocerca flexuosa]|uniref:Uncharacterized protein n=1 Tax=Onchocerca flexuosa TaxID=387005 RepID=A0A183HT26_9BILA